MPTPNPSVLPAVVSTAATLFTDNWNTIVTAVVALIGIVTLPALVARGGIRAALHGLSRVFHIAR